MSPSSSAATTNHFVCIIVTARRRLAIARIGAEPEADLATFQEVLRLGLLVHVQAGFEIIFQDELTINPSGREGGRGSYVDPFERPQLLPLRTGWDHIRCPLAEWSVNDCLGALLCSWR